MNQARIWLVVNPTVGLPLFLGSVALIALLVHFQVLTHSSWYPAYLEGGAKTKAVVEATAPAPAAPMAAAMSTPAAPAPASAAAPK
jgi:light-harvesting protein B-800-850 alpha chain